MAKPTFFDPNKPIPQEILDAMLELSTAEETDRDLERQMLLSQSLIKGATSLDQAPIGGGGVPHAIAKALQGYAGGKMYKRDSEEQAKLRAMQRANRGKYYGLAGADLPPMEEPPIAE